MKVHVQSNPLVCAKLRKNYHICLDYFTTRNCTFFCSAEECRQIILQFGVREVTASQVARVLGMMARTHSGLTDGISLQVNIISENKNI